MWILTYCSVVTSYAVLLRCPPSLLYSFGPSNKQAAVPLTPSIASTRRDGNGTPLKSIALAKDFPSQSIVNVKMLPMGLDATSQAPRESPVQIKAPTVQSSRVLDTTPMCSLQHRWQCQCTTMGQICWYPIFPLMYAPVSYTLQLMRQS